MRVDGVLVVMVWVRDAGGATCTGLDCFPLTGLAWWSKERGLLPGLGPLGRRDVSTSTSTTTYYARARISYWLGVLCSHLVGYLGNI